MGELVKVKELLDSEEKWCQGTSFARIDGQPCPIENATRFCLLGAIEKCYGHSYVEKYKAGMLLKEAIPDGRLVSLFNDSSSTTFADIQRVLELADV